MLSLFLLALLLVALLSARAAADVEADNDLVCDGLKIALQASSTGEDAKCFDTGTTCGDCAVNKKQNACAFCPSGALPRGNFGPRLSFLARL